MPRLQRQMLGWLLIVAVMTSNAACTEDVPITTEPGRKARELVVSRDVGFGPSTTVLLVLTDDERATATEPAIALVRTLVTGDADGDGISEHFAWPNVRVAVVTPEWFDALISNEPCVAPNACAITQKVARYQWQPYSFAPTSEQPFLDNVRCLLSDDTTNCIDDNAGNDADPQWLTPFMPITSDDLATLSTDELLALDRLSGAYDLPPWDGGSTDRVLLEDDGRAQCELKETLPVRGPITRCEQLAAFGRTLDHVDADGRDVCIIKQLPPDHGDSILDGHGFYYYDGRDAPSYGLLPFANRNPEYTCKCGVSYVPGEPHLLMTLGTPFVPGSTINLRCALNAGK